MYNLKNIYIFLSLFIITFILFFHTFNYPFILLDNTLDQHIISGIEFKNFLWAFTHIPFDYWKPITLISHMIDWSLYGSNSGGHHLTNVIIHYFSCIVLFKISLHLTKCKLSSFIISLLFSIHPMHLESVVWVAERKDVLSVLFALLSTLSYIKYLGECGKKFYILSIFLFLLCLMSKPSIVTLPVILLLLDYYYHCFNVKSFFNKTPFFILSILFTLLTVQVVNDNSGISSLNSIPIFIRFLNSINSYYFYIIKFLFPINLSIFYVYKHDYNLTFTFLKLIFLITILFLSIKKRKNNPLFFIGIFWFLVVLLPVIGIIQAGDQSKANRFVYFPYIGLYFSFISLFNQIKFNWTIKLTLITLVIGYLIIIHQIEISYWKNSETLFKRAIELKNNSFLIHNNLGCTLYDKKKYEQSESHFKMSIKLNNEFTKSYNNLGLVFIKQNKMDSAKILFKKSSYLDAKYIEPNINISKLYLKEIELDSSHKYLYKSYQLDSTNQSLINELGKYYYLKKDFNKSLHYYFISLKQDSTKWEISNNIGLNYYKLNNYYKASIYFEKALLLNDNLDVYNNLIASEIKINPKKALNILNFLISKYPNNSDLINKRNKINHLLNNVDHTKAN